MSTRVIVIGAGWSGLAAAKTYLQINPSISLTILDDDESVGGVWSNARLYPGLLANSPNGLYEFSDLSMVDDDHPAYAVVPGSQVQQYLHRYAVKHGLLQRIKFGSKVIDAHRIAGGWEVHTSKGEVLWCDKLLVSTGLYSRPKWPVVPQDGFDGFVMHSKSLGSQHHRLTSPEVNEVAIVGGCKSAVEAATICLQAGKQVHWIVRDSVQGVPIIMADASGKFNIVALNNSRLFSIWSPTVFSADGFWYRFLHSGAWLIGTWLFNLFWRFMSVVILAGAKYDTSLNGRKLKPTNTTQFWNVPYVSLIWEPNPFLKHLHNGEQISVHRTTPTSLVGRQMQLDNGESVRADAVVYATGWLPTIDFFNNTDAKDLGIPVASTEQDKPTAEKWRALDSQAQTKIQAKFPVLRDVPTPPHKQSDTSPYRLYRQVVSPELICNSDHSITFVGLVSNSQTAFCSEITALWAVAWMENLLPRNAIPSHPDETYRSVAEVNAWIGSRYALRGLKDPEIIIEIQSFFDTMLKDLGLRVKRKQKGIFGIFREWMLPYKPEDYAGIIEEFMANVKPKKE